MNFLIGVFLGLKEIWANRFRSLLTMVGVILGVAALVAMIGVLQGHFDATEQWIAASGGLERVMIRDAVPPKEQAHLAGLSPGRTFVDAQAIRGTCSLAAYVSPEVDLKHPQLQRGSKQIDARTQGVTPDVLQIYNYELAAGRMISPLDLERFSKVAVVGTAVEAALFTRNESALGHFIHINGLPFEVIGLLKHYEKRYGGRNVMGIKNEIAFIPVTTMQMRLTGTERLTGLNVEAADVRLLDQLVEQLENTLLVTHRGIRDFRVETQQEMIQRFEQARGTVMFAMGGVAAISLLVGGIGITNVMLASINERIREIGIRKAVGAGLSQIFIQFVAESVALSVLGGLLGLLVAVGLIGLLRAVFASVDLEPKVSVGALLLGFICSVAMGILAGIYPAVRASRLDPIEALRYE